MKKTLRPKEFPFIVVEPGKQLIVLSITCKPVTYSFEIAEFHRAILNLFSKHGVNVLRAYKQKLPEGMEWVFFMDLSKVEALEQLLESLKGLPETVSVDWVGPERDVIVDLLHFPMTSRGGVRMIIFSAEMLSKVLTELYKTFGTGASFILYKLGFDYGEELAAHFKKMLAAVSGGVEFPPKKVLETFFKYLISAGWERLEGFEISTEGRIEASVKVKDLWEALARKGLKMEGLNCDLFRGFLAGFFTTLYGIEFKAVEVACEAKGAPHCEFHIVEQA